MPDFVIVDHPAKSPGLCAACGSHGGRMVDTGVDLEPPNGALYLCVTCVAAWAVRLGWGSPEAIDEWETLYGQKATQVEQLEREVAALKASQVQVVSLADALAAAAPAAPQEGRRRRGA